MNSDRTETINMIIGTNQEKINFDIISSSGTSNYELLSNKPRINSVELVGNKTSDELNLQKKGNYANTPVTNIEIDNLFR